MTLFLFTSIWFLLIYLFYSALSRTFTKIHIQRAFLYITTVSLIGIFGEVFGNTLYTTLFGLPLWVYHFTPIHNGYTSLYSVVVWGMYGFYLYLAHDIVHSHQRKTHWLATLIASEAVVLEILLNGSFMLCFNDYFFYYLPNDLWHLSSIQAIPFYFFAGIVIVKTMKHFEEDPLFFSCMNCMLIYVFAALS